MMSVIMKPAPKSKIVNEAGTNDLDCPVHT